MQLGVIVFPGSNCDRDCVYALEETLHLPVTMVWHEERDLSSFDAILLPGGFSFGDYLRPGAMASVSPIMTTVKNFATTGKLVLGICNGFQILLEAGLLSGILLPNTMISFRCAPQTLRVNTIHSPFTNQYEKGEVISLPIAHQTGNYYCTNDELTSLYANDQILFTYEGNNPNGSLQDIAGICNKDRNVLGLMPHPERAVQPLLGSTDGRRLFASMLHDWRVKHESFAGI